MDHRRRTFPYSGRRLHELAVQPNPEHVTYAAEVAELQHAAFTELVELARPLVSRLSKL
jgi:hypothetical protein